MKVNRSFKLDPSKIKFLFDWDWYDGPLNGLMEYEGQKLWHSAGKRYWVKGKCKDVCLCFKLPDSYVAQLEEAASSETQTNIDPPYFNSRENKRKYPFYGYFLGQDV